MKRRTIGLLLAGMAVTGGIVTTGIANAASSTNKTIYGEWRDSENGAVADTDLLGREKCQIAEGGSFTSPTVERLNGQYRLRVDCFIVS